MTKRQIFQDSSGRRWLFASAAFSALATLVFLVFASAIIGILFPADLPSLSLHEGTDPPFTDSLGDNDGPVAAAHERPFASPPATALSRQQAFQKLSFIRSAFTVQDDPSSVKSLRAHLSELNVVFPDGLSFSNSEGNIDVSVDPETFELLRSAGKFVLPRISNTNAEGEWDVSGLALLFRNAKATEVFIEQTISVLDRLHADGVNLDIEGLSVADENAFVAWLEEIAAALHARGLLVTVDVPMGVDGYNLKSISAVSDAVVLMAYDEHFQTGPPGSIAGQDWFDDGLEDALRSIPRDKLIVGIGAYGYDWSDGKATAEPIGFYDATQLAARFGATIETDSAAINSRFAYEDEAGTHHQVWLLDAVSAWNEIVTVRRSQARGLAVWRTGLEEPTLWSLLGAGVLPTLN